MGVFDRYVQAVLEDNNLYLGWWWGRLGGLGTTMNTVRRTPSPPIYSFTFLLPFAISNDLGVSLKSGHVVSYGDRMFRVLHLDRGMIYVTDIDQAPMMVRCGPIADIADNYSVDLALGRICTMRSRDNFERGLGGFSVQDHIIDNERDDSGHVRVLQVRGRTVHILDDDGLDYVYYDVYPLFSI
jgi:hypothetical protein